MKPILLLDLDLPPSINMLYATVKTAEGGMRRVKSREGKLWKSYAIDTIQMAMNSQNWSCEPDSRISISVTLHFAGTHNDLDNRHKLFQDTLCQVLGLNDDDQVDEIHKYRGTVDRNRPHIVARVYVLGEKANKVEKKEMSREDQIAAAGWKRTTIFDKPAWTRDGEAVIDNEDFYG